MLTYRKARQRRAGEAITHQAAIDAYLLVRPQDDREEAAYQIALWALTYFGRPFG